jgi:hypothetical protein
MSQTTASEASPRMLGRSALPLNELALVLAIALVFVVTGLLDRNHTYFTNFQSSAVIILRNTVILGMIALGAAVVIVSGGIDLSVGSMMAFSATTCALVMTLFTEPSDKMLMNVGPLGVSVRHRGGPLGRLSGRHVAHLADHRRFACRRLWPRSPRSSACGALPGQCASSSPHSGGAASTSRSTSTRRSSSTSSSTCGSRPRSSSSWRSSLGSSSAGRSSADIFMPWAATSRRPACRASAPTTSSGSPIASGRCAPRVAGIFAMADGSVAQPVNLARGYELNAIAAAVVGGCSLQGGVGTVTGTVLGALFLRVVIDAVAKLIKAGADVYEGMIVGIVVVMAVTLTMASAPSTAIGPRVLSRHARGDGDPHAGDRRGPLGHDGQRQRRGPARADVRLRRCGRRGYAGGPGDREVDRTLTAREAVGARLKNFLIVLYQVVRVFDTTQAIRRCSKPTNNSSPASTRRRCVRSAWHRPLSGVGVERAGGQAEVLPGGVPHAVLHRLLPRSRRGFVQAAGVSRRQSRFFPRLRRSSPTACRRTSTTSRACSGIFGTAAARWPTSSRRKRPRS